MYSSQPGTASSLHHNYQPTGENVIIDQTTLHIDLVDGRGLDVPLAHWAFLAQATPAQRQAWEFTFDCQGIYWPLLDEYLSIAYLLGLPAD